MSFVFETYFGVKGSNMQMFFSNFCSAHFAHGDDKPGEFRLFLFFMGYPFRVQFSHYT